MRNGSFVYSAVSLAPTTISLPASQEPGIQRPRIHDAGSHIRAYQAIHESTINREIRHESLLKCKDCLNGVQHGRIPCLRILRNFEHAPRGRRLEAQAWELGTKDQHGNPHFSDMRPAWLSSSNEFPGRSTWFTKHPTWIGLLAFVVIYVLTVFYARHISYRDPGSLFFDADSAYALQYSNQRLEQAEHFLELASKNASLSHSPPNAQDAQICIGIPSVARENVRYLRTTVASLLEGLSGHERISIFLIVLIAESDPYVHPAYGEPWLDNLADKVLLYDLSPAELEHVKEMETRHGGGEEKRLYDYFYVMNACYSTGTPYIALFEDDVLAMDGWLHRTMAAIQEAEERSQAERGESGDFFLLRLFYTEEFLGWNSENAGSHVAWSIAFVVYVAASISWIRSQSAFLQRWITARAILIFCGVCTPMFILLFFSAGKLTVMPPPSGVHELDYMCCSQGFVFPQRKAVELMRWYEEKPNRQGHVDVAIARYAERNHELQLTLTPPVIQHIGRVSSKRSHGTKIFNIAFELNDASRLRIEHAALTDSGLY